MPNLSNIQDLAQRARNLEKGCSGNSTVHPSFIPKNRSERVLKRVEWVWNFPNRPNLTTFISPKNWISITVRI